MSGNIVSFATEPYASWDEGILALCDSIADRHRLPVVLRRLERTAERLPLSEEDLCILALVCPVDAPTEAIEPNIAKLLEDTGLDQPAPELPEWRLKIKVALDAIEDFRRAREKVAEEAFGPDDPRRILGDTLWGFVAASVVETSDRLDAKDPFRRLGTRLGLWFAPSSMSRWMGVPLGEDCLGIQDLLRRLVAQSRSPGADNAPVMRLLRIATQANALPCSLEGLAVLNEIGEAIEGQAARVLFDSLMLAVMEAIGWDNPKVLDRADVDLACSVGNRSNQQSETSPAATVSLPDWLRQGRRAVLLPDLAWFLPELCFHLHEWPEDRPPAVLNSVIELVRDSGFSTFTQGPFPLNCYRHGETKRELPARLAESLPEAHDLLRLLSLRSSDWSEAGGELGAGFWGYPSRSDDTVMDLRSACKRAIVRGDPALADMLLGSWLIFMMMVRCGPLPHVPDIARVIRRIPLEDRVSINAVLGLISADLASDPRATRQLSALLSYLPPVPVSTPSDPEAELRTHLGDEAWGWLPAEAKKVLLENERLFRDWRRLGEADANARGPSKLLPHWAALFELLLRRALRRCDRALAVEITDRIPLGELLQKVGVAWKLAEGWPAEDERRLHLVGNPWLEMLEGLNKANTRWGKHLASDGTPAPSWREVAALRSRVIFGGALQRCLEAAGNPSNP